MLTQSSFISIAMLLELIATVIFVILSMLRDSATDTQRISKLFLAPFCCVKCFPVKRVAMLLCYNVGSRP